MDRYTIKDVVKVLDIPRERVREWLKRGFVSATFPSPGERIPAEFSLDDLYRIKAFEQMLYGGLARETAAGYIQALSDTQGWLGKMRPPDDVIVFRRYGRLESGSGRLESAGLSVSGQKGWFVDLETGGVSTRSLPFQIGKTSTYRPPGDPDRERWDWSDIYIFNYRKVREFVGSRLAEL